MEFTRDFLERFLENHFGCIPEGLFIDDEEEGCGSLDLAFSDKATFEELVKVTMSGSEKYEFNFEGYKYDAYAGYYKIAFVFEDFDNVIKIPFSGVYFYDGKKSELEYYHRKDAIKAEKELYDDKNGFINNWDESIEKYLMRKYFLNNEYLFRWGNLPVYQQKKVNLFTDKYTWEEIEKLYETKYSKDIHDEIDEIVEDTKKFKDIECYCGTVEKIFFAEIIKREPELSKEDIEFFILDDLAGNITFLTDMTPVCFDYGGREMCW